ncbi:unnamed protein product [Symbiodinium pilosum]|uniref:Uncharacterized protein n=1 Tax=Symbiodinium pilosum TaxID=2952 RepID=A0A812JJN7_SYMPI|nr:unnamed protein product [Symbiodinium pilosum]
MGTAAEFQSTGYTYDIVPGTVGFSIGASLTGAQSLDNLIRGKPPVGYVTIDLGFSVGATYKLAWTGLGIGGGFGCGSDGSCSAYLAIGAVGTVNLPTASPLCPLGVTIPAPPAPPQWTCSQVIGGTISTMCCSMDLRTGKNDCR